MNYKKGTGLAIMSVLSLIVSLFLAIMYPHMSVLFGSIVILSTLSFVLTVHAYELPVISPQSKELMTKIRGKK
jgi:hypothetical protein